MKSKITTIFIQVSIIVIYYLCDVFQNDPDKRETIARVVLTCVTLILTFTFIKGRHKKRGREKS